MEKSLSQLTTKQDSRQSPQTVQSPQAGQRHSSAAVPRAGGKETQAECSGVCEYPVFLSTHNTMFYAQVELPRSTHCPNKVSFLLQELQ